MDDESYMPRQLQTRQMHIRGASVETHAALCDTSVHVVNNGWQMVQSSMEYQPSCGASCDHLLDGDAPLSWRSTCAAGGCDDDIKV